MLQQWAAKLRLRRMARRRGPNNGRLAAMPYLFSYGTLQQEAVQLSTFGRCLVGDDDSLTGYVLGQQPIANAASVAVSGRALQPIAKHTGDHHHHIPGTVYAVTEDDLKLADRYEVEAYRRIHVTLESGKQAWAYVEA